MHICLRGENIYCREALERFYRVFYLGDPTRFVCFFCAMDAKSIMEKCKYLGVILQYGKGFACILIRGGKMLIFMPASKKADKV